MKFEQVAQENLSVYGFWDAVFTFKANLQEIIALTEWLETNTTEHVVICAVSTSTEILYCSRSTKKFRMDYDLRFNTSEDAILFKLTWM